MILEEIKKWYYDRLAEEGFAQGSFGEWLNSANNKNITKSICTGDFLLIADNVKCNALAFCIAENSEDVWKKYLEENIECMYTIVSRTLMRSLFPNILVINEQLYSIMENKNVVVLIGNNPTLRYIIENSDIEVLTKNLLDI